jgi:CRISPR-associated protein (TIGR02584 family)
LLAATGLSPQVVTETLCALAVTETPSFIPTEVRLITTAEGSERARLALLSDDPGWFLRLRTDYALPEIAFNDDHIHVLCDASGEPLTDIRTPQDNERAADFISDMVRNVTSDPDCALHVSIAGGRKTMGYYLGYALSLFGRPQDRLSHVLVSEPFEASWEFFYPTPYSRVITTRDNKLADTSEAKVTLAEVPFVSLRHGLPEDLLAGQSSFNATVAAARATLGPWEIVVDVEQKQIAVAGERFRLPPRELAILCVFAEHARSGGAPLAAPPKDVPDPAWAQRYLAQLRRVSGPAADLDATERALRKGMDGDYFSQGLSRLRAILQRYLGRQGAARLIDDGGTRPHRYQLGLPAEAIRFAVLPAVRSIRKPAR